MKVVSWNVFNLAEDLNAFKDVTKIHQDGYRDDLANQLLSAT